MKSKFLLFIFLLLPILSACGQSVETLSKSSLPEPTKSQSPPESSTSAPEIASSTSTPTPIPDEQVFVTTHESPDLVMTAINLQLESNNIKLTQSADQIATLSAKSSALETQLAVVSTTSATSFSESSNQNSSNSEYNIPSNVHTVVTVDKAVIFVVHSTNKAGAPIMLPYKPRVVLPPGREAWVYKNPVKADGGTIYYESYDPDGQSELKVYFKWDKIQIRLPTGNPDPSKFPENVAKAKIIDNTALFTADSYDQQGKPIMEVYQPRIRYSAGDYEIVYPEYVIATGGSHWYPVYDSDGTPSGYIRSTKISFPAIWD